MQRNDVCIKAVRLIRMTHGRRYLRIDIDSRETRLQREQRCSYRRQVATLHIFPTAVASYLISTHWSWASGNIVIPLWIHVAHGSGVLNSVTIVLRTFNKSVVNGV